MLDKVVETSGLARQSIMIVCSHTHAAGLMSRDRAELPGGEMLAPYLDGLHQTIGQLAADGAYELKSHGGRSGLQPGEYQVVIQAYEGSFIENNVRYLVPKQFAHVETSGLSATIPAGAADDMEFNYNLE